MSMMRRSRCSISENMGTFESVSSDHAPYRFDETGKFLNGTDVYA